MENFFYLQSDKEAKYVLMMTQGFWHLLSTLMEKRTPYAKVDLIFVDAKGALVGTYGNGTEVSFYEIDKDDSIRFTYYTPSKKNQRRQRQFVEDLTGFSNKDLMEKLTRVLKKWAKDTKEEYPRHMLCDLIYLGELENRSRIFAVPIGYAQQWQNQDFLQRLFRAYIDNWKKHIPMRRKYLNSEDFIKDANCLTDSRSIILSACDKELSFRFGMNSNQEKENSESLFDVLCSVSSMPYESAQNHGCLGFVSRFESLDKLTVMYFEESILFEMKNCRKLRKLLEMTSESMALLVRNGSVIGIGDREYIKTGISFCGNGKWILFSKKVENPVFTVEGTRCYMNRTTKSNVKRVYKQCFGKTDKAEFIDKIIETAKKQKHGTSIVISEEAKEEAERLCSLNRGIKTTPIDLFENSKIIKAVTSIDGAVLIDENGICYAIGVILDGDAVLTGSAARGARYNSLCNYVKRRRSSEKGNNRCFAVIISEDGTTDIYPSETDFLRMPALELDCG